jgi:hypothetical protein
MLFVQLANRLQDEGALDELELAKMLKDASQGIRTEAQDASEFLNNLATEIERAKG